MSASDLPSNRCSRCGARLPSRPQGAVCPRCALEDVLASPPSDHDSQFLSLHDIPPPGQKVSYIGDYELLEVIARGGMGVVYKARQRSLNRVVALKMLLSGVHAGDDFKRRFRQEAKMAAKLQHPNIVPIYEVGEHEGQPYFAMEYISGETLANKVRDRPLLAKEAANYVKTVAEAVHYGHLQGILHRDLKPSNILLGADDRPRITDFGLAREVDADSSLTISGQALGTPGYLPPEQASGQRDGVGPWSDVYALGAVLYHLLTGRPPFAAGSVADTLDQVRHTEPVRPRQLNPSVPKDLETLCLKCLEKEPARRYRSAQMLADDLARWLQGEPILARPVGRWERIHKWYCRKPVVAGLTTSVVALFIIGLGLAIWQWREVVFERNRAEQGEAGARRSHYLANMSLIQQAWEQNNIQRIRELLEETATFPTRGFEWYYWQRQIHLELKTNTVTFSPDERIITGSQDHTTKVWNLSRSNEPVSLKGHTAPIRSAAFSRDGQWIVTGSEDGTAKVWEADSGKELLTLKGHRAEIYSAAFSPDDQRIVTASEDRTAKLWRADNGSELLILKGHKNAILGLAFSPDGQQIVTGSRDRTAKVWETATGRELLTFKCHAWVLCVAFSPDGKRIVTGSNDGTATMWEAANGRELLMLKGNGGEINSVAFSPDGQRIVTGGADHTARLWEAASGRELLALNGHNAAVMSVAFSPDGQRIVTGSADRTAKVWDTSGGRELLTLKGHDGSVSVAAFSADGRRIVTGSGDGTAKVWTTASTEQVRAWQQEDQAADKAWKARRREQQAAREKEAALQREIEVKRERERIARYGKDEGALKRWLILAPILLNTNQTSTAGLETEQLAHEAQLHPRADEIVVIGGQRLLWKTLDHEDYVIDFSAELGQMLHHSVAYAVCYIKSDREQLGLRLLVGSDDQSKVYLNEVEIYKAPIPRAFTPDQDTVPEVHLKAGLNVLVFKVVNEDWGWLGSIRFTDAAGKPVPGLHASSTPD